MNSSLLLQWWDFARGEFLKPLVYFLPVHSGKKPRTRRNMVLKIPTEWDFSRFLGQVFDWLSAVNRAKTCLEVLLHLSPEKKRKLTGVLHDDKLTWEAGDLFSLHITLRLQGERDRSAGSKTLGTRRAGRSSTWSEAAETAGTSLAKGSESRQSGFYFFLKVKGFLSSGAVGPDPTGAQLCEEHRVQAFFITMSHLLPSNLHHCSKGSAVQWAPAGFFL